MLAPTGVTSMPFGMTGAPEFLHLVPLPGLPLLAPSGNRCPTGVTSKPTGAAGLVIAGVMNKPFETTRALEPGQPEPPRMAEVAEHLVMARAAGYVDAAGYAMPIGTTRVTRFAVWGSSIGTIRQYTSDGRYKPTVCSGVNARFKTAGVADGAHGVTRHTGPAWADVGSAGLSPFFHNRARYHQSENRL